MLLDQAQVYCTVLLKPTNVILLQISLSGLFSPLARL